MKQPRFVRTEGRMHLTCKPLRGLGSGVFEVALAHRGDAFRVVYAVQLGDAVWVIHAFQKKSARPATARAHQVTAV